MPRKTRFCDGFVMNMTEKPVSENNVFINLWLVNSVFCFTVERLQHKALKVMYCMF